MTGTKEALAKTDFILKYVKARPINACGKTSFMQLVCLIRHCQLFITPDSAPLHLAAAVGAPCIALFGPTCAKRHLPPGDKILALQKDIACAPCYHRQCRHSRCMKQIGVEEMLEAMRTLVPGLFKKGEISVVK
jgi:ADP-heptose:LPS heptosyltransferase